MNIAVNTTMSNILRLYGSDYDGVMNTLQQYGDGYDGTWYNNIMISIYRRTNIIVTAIM